MTEIVEKVQLTEDQKKRQNKRSVAIAITLGVLVVLFYAITLVKMGPEVLNRPM